MESPSLFPILNRRQELGYLRLTLIFLQVVFLKSDPIQGKIYAEIFTSYCIILQNASSLLPFAKTSLGTLFK